MNQTMTATLEHSTILLRIKQETRKYHDAIEQNIFAKRLMGGTMTPAEYLAFLKKFYGYHAALEERFRGISGWKNYGIILEQREKLPLLHQDLSTLEVAEHEIQTLPICTELPAINNIFQAFGALYVMEGSTLGGQIQMRQLHKIFGSTAIKATAYFSSYGASVGMMWKEFCAALMALSTDNPDQEDNIIATACETFQTLHRWLDNV